MSLRKFQNSNFFKKSLNFLFMEFVFNFSGSREDYTQDPVFHSNYYLFWTFSHFFQKNFFWVVHKSFSKHSEHISIRLRITKKLKLTLLEQGHYFQLHVWFAKKWFQSKILTSTPFTWIFQSSRLSVRLFVCACVSNTLLPRMLCNGNGAISHLQTEMGFVEDFSYGLYNW